MSKDKISDYSETPGNNTDIGGINIAEGMLPSDVNNAIREQMAQLKKFQSGTSGESVTFVTANVTTANAGQVNVDNLRLDGNTLSSTNTNGDIELTPNGNGRVTTPALSATSPRVITAINDTNGNELFGVTATTSAVNEFTVANAATGNAPTLSATGSDTNIGMALTPKGTGGVIFPAGAVGTPAITTTGDLNTGIFFPAADTIAFTEGGAEAMRIDSSGRVGIGTTSPDQTLVVKTANGGGIAIENASAKQWRWAVGSDSAFTCVESGVAERMRIDSSGNVGIGTSSPNGTGFTAPVLSVTNGTSGIVELIGTQAADGTVGQIAWYNTSGSARIGQILGVRSGANNSGAITFQTASAGTIAERARITNIGDIAFGMTTPAVSSAGQFFKNDDPSARYAGFTNDGNTSLSPVYINRQGSDGTLIQFRQADADEGSISVSGATVSYNAFCGGHWTQLQEGRGYNPDIPRGTVMSSIGEMAEWKSVTWTETIEHPAVAAVEAKEAVLDEDGNVVEPAVEAVEGKDACTESISHRESYLGNLDIGETFEEDGFTKTVVNDDNERLPKVKISDVVGDKAVYGVFQTWDSAQDMIISSLGAFVVRIAAGVTVEVGDLLESNGDGCAKVQDDDIIRSKTIGKVTSTIPTDTYDDGSYTVPCVLYCG